MALRSDGYIPAPPKDRFRVQPTPPILVLQEDLVTFNSGLKRQTIIWCLFILVLWLRLRPIRSVRRIENLWPKKASCWDLNISIEIRASPSPLGRALPLRQPEWPGLMQSLTSFAYKWQVQLAEAQPGHSHSQSRRGSLWSAEKKRQNFCPAEKRTRYVQGENWPSAAPNWELGLWGEVQEMFSVCLHFTKQFWSWSPPRRNALPVRGSGRHWGESLNPESPRGAQNSVKGNVE